MKIEDMLAEKYVCAKCKNRNAHADRFAATGTGFSKLFDIQHKKFITLSCTNCGYTEIYNPSILEGKDNVSDIIDFIFGG